MASSDSSNPRILRVANWSVALCVAAVAATLCAAAAPLIARRLGWATPAKPAPSYVAGDLIDVPASVYNTTGKTLIVFSASNCGACQRAVPLFAEITAQIRRMKNTKVAMVTRDLSGAEDEYTVGRQMGIDRGDVHPMNLSSLRLKQIPTTLVVDQSGRILLAAEGIPSDEVRAAILSSAVSN